MPLDIISEIYEGTAEIRRFTAPSGHMYLVKGFQFSNFASASARFIISREYAEEGTAILTDERGCMFSFDLAIDGMADSLCLQDGILTKHISMGFKASAGYSCTIRIYYELVKASMAELVWEFLKRGKQP